MRAGIYLGARRGSLRRAGLAFAWLFLALTVAHAVLRYGQWRELAAARADTEALGGNTTDSLGGAAGQDDADRELLARLRAALDIGTMAAVPPTEVLRLLESTLPEGVVLVSVSIEPSPPRASLTLEAVAESASDVTKMQESVAGSDRVASTELLEERRAPDGTLSVRLQVNLHGGRLP